VGKNVGVLFSWDIYRIPPKSKYQSWYLIPCNELEVQNPTKALKSVKGQCNTFDVNPTWERTLQSFDNFSCDIYKVLPKSPNIKVDIWYPAVGLRFRIPPRHLSLFKAPAIPLIYIPSVKKLPSFSNFSWDIDRVPLSAWVGFCTSSPQQGVTYQLWYFALVGGEPYKYPMNNCQRTAKFFPTWGLVQRYCPGL
jgi:hypothetical protein